MDLTAIEQAFNAIKAIKDISKRAIDAHDAKVRAAATTDLSDALFNAQSAMYALSNERAALVKREAELEARIVELETWNLEKERYELKARRPGAFTYALRPEYAGSEPPHDICPTCYQRGKKSILQAVGRSTMKVEMGIPATLQCPECKAEVLV